MIKKYITHLQGQSHTKKNNFALVASMIITGLITVVWFFVIFMNPTDYFKTGPSEAQNLANTGSLFDVFKASVK